MSDTALRRRRPRHLRDRARRTLRRARRHRARCRRRARHRRSPRPHDARPRAARSVPRGDREAARWRNRASRRSSTRVPRRRRGTADGCRARGSRCARSTPPRRWRRRTAPARSSSAARITSRASRCTCCARPSAAWSRSCRAPIRRSLRGRAARRPHADHHAESDRRRPADVGRPDPDRHLELDHEHGIRAPADEGRQEAARRVAHRPRRATRPTIRRALSAEPKGALLPLGGLDAGYKGFGLGAPHRSADGGTRRSRPRRSAGRLGRHGVRAGARSGGVRRTRGIQAADGSHRRRRARVEAARRRRLACGCRARREWRACASSARTASRSIPTIMPALVPWAEKLGVGAPNMLS